MELRHLRYFVAVAEELHFGRAALRLGIAQPPLSQQIRALEAELGVQLLERTKRRVDLTDAGRRFLHDARATLRQAEHAAATARRASEGESGRLSIGVVPWVDFTRVPRVIRDFSTRHPHVHLEVHGLNGAEQTEALRLGRIHVGFSRPPIDPRTQDSERVLAEPLVVAFPEGHRFEASARVPIRSLADEPYILLPRQRAPHYFDRIAALFRHAGFGLRVTHEADHPYTVLGLVAAGMGVSLVPASLATVLRLPVAYRPLRPSGPRLETVLTWRRADASPVLRAFLEVVRAFARGERMAARSTPARVGSGPTVTS